MENLQHEVNTEVLVLRVLQVVLFFLAQSCAVTMADKVAWEEGTDVYQNESR